MPPHTEGFYDPKPLDKSTDKPNLLNPPHSTPTNSPTAPESPGPSGTVNYIPGLPPNSLVTTPKKSQKRRKKKTKTENLIEHRGSTSSEESEILQFSAAVECNSMHPNNKVSFEQKIEEFVPEPIHEIHLTYDLADSLVNPPTDPEASDDEVSHQNLSTLTILPNDPQVEENKEKLIEKNSSTESNAAVNTTNNNDKNKDIMKLDETELEDKEVSEITGNIKD